MLKGRFDQTYRILKVHGTNHLYQECTKDESNMTNRY